MHDCNKLLEELKAGQLDESLARVYDLHDGGKALEQGRERSIHVTEEFIKLFGNQADAGLYTGPGRTEICGNHTDHQRGRVLAAAVDLDFLVCAAPNGTNTIRFMSEGWHMVEVNLDNLEPVEEEKEGTAALVRGVAAGIAQRGYTPVGFDAYATSKVLPGSGLSSSAACEVTIGVILNHLVCGDALDAVTIAQIGQYAENVFFGKPCGLMDQTASSVGGAVAIDFADTANPVVRPIQVDLAGYGHALCIIDSGADHADLTAEYAAIPQEMKAVAAYFGCEVLREVDESRIWADMPGLRPGCTCKTLPPPALWPSRPWQWLWPRLATPSRAGALTGSTAAVSPAPSRRSCLWICWTSSRPPWSPCWELAAAMCSPSVLWAAPWCADENQLNRKGANCNGYFGFGWSRIHRFSHRL